LELLSCNYKFKYPNHGISFLQI